MFKNLICLIATLVLISACSTNSDQDGLGANTGDNSNPALSGAPTNGGVVAGGVQDFATIGDRIFFGYNASDISNDARKTLDGQIAWLKNNMNATAVIEGHCDNRGTREYNLALGDRRATAVRDYMVAGGIDLKRLRTISYGKERPAVVGDNEAAWAQNRRGVTVIVK